MSTSQNTVIPLYISSKDRINRGDSTTNFTVTLRKDLRNISSISVSNVGIPRTYTNINKNNNTLLITFSAEGPETIPFSITISVEAKDYTGATLAVALQTALDLNTTSVEIGLDWTITFDDDTGFYAFAVQYDAGASITWNVSLTYTPLIDIIGIGEGGTTEDSYNYSATETDLLAIPVNRRAALFNNLQLNITSTALTNDINTSYVTSLAKSFTVDSSNSLVAFDVKQRLTKYSTQLQLGTDSIGDVFFGFTVDISGDGNTFIVGAYADDGYTGSTYTFVKQSNGVDYFQTPTNKKTQSLAASANGQEGSSVAISTDGLTMVTGAREDDWELIGGKRLGAAYIYAWTGSQWVKQLKITPSSVTPLDQQLGTQVAISGDGAYVVASGLVETVMYIKDGNKWDEGKKFPFTTTPQLNTSGSIMTLYVPSLGMIQAWSRTGAAWTLTQSISSANPVNDMSDDGTILVTAGNPVNVYIHTGSYVLDGAPLSQIPSEFGTSVAISGDGKTIAVGDPTTNPGLVWIYNKTTSWTLYTTISPTTTSPNHPFAGYSVRLNTTGTTLIIGGPSANNNIGAAYVWQYDITDTTWKQIGSTPVVPTGYSADTDQGYSSAVAKGSSVFVTGGPFDRGERGAAWIYTRELFTWSQASAKLLPSDISDTVARFGHSVDISADGKTVVVGGPGDFGGGVSSSDNTGAVWVFRDTSIDGDGSQWTQDGLKLYGAPYTYTRQGTSVAINGDGTLIAVGAPTSGDGSVFMFTYAADQWTQQGAAINHNGVSSMSMQGWAVALDEAGVTLAIGCPGSEAVAMFQWDGGAWAEESLVTGTGVGFGSAVALSLDGLNLAVGAPGATSGDQGWASVFVRSDITEPWVVQTTIDGTPFGSSVDLSADGNVLCVGSLDGLSQTDITSRTYAYTRTGTTWSQFDDPIVGERRTNTEDYQGFSSSVEYLDDSADFQLIIGGIGFGAFQGGNWSYISAGTFDTVETMILPVRSYTIFDLINVLNVGMAEPLNVNFTYQFDTNTGTVQVVIAADNDRTSNVIATFKPNISNTFDVIDFPADDSYRTSIDSRNLDFSINNNIIKTVDTSRISNNVIYDTTTDRIFRKYEAGFSLLSTGSIDVQLRDERDRIIDLYGADWVMTCYAEIHN